MGANELETNELETDDFAKRLSRTEARRHRGGSWHGTGFAGVGSGSWQLKVEIPRLQVTSHRFRSGASEE
jgi:hypothetical protein